MLYSNQQLLSKYNMEVPKNWDELIETSKYIIKKEKELNNTNNNDLIIYNGLINGIYI